MNYLCMGSFLCLTSSNDRVMSNDHKFLLKEQFAQQFKYSRYLITTMPTEVLQSTKHFPGVNFQNSVNNVFSNQLRISRLPETRMITDKLCGAVLVLFSGLCFFSVLKQVQFTVLQLCSRLLQCCFALLLQKFFSGLHQCGSECIMTELSFFQ